MNDIRAAVVRRVPAPFVDELRFRRTARCWRTVGVVFVHVPKNAGVSICQSIYGRPLGHYPAIEIERRAPGLLSGSYSFAVVRDPLERLMSAYRFARQGATREMGVANRETYQQPIFATFDSFVREWLVFQNMANVDAIFRSQSSYILLGSSQAVDELFALFDLRGLEQRLSAVLTRPVIIGHRNTTERQPLRPEPATVAAVNELYAADYEAFGRLLSAEH